LNLAPPDRRIVIDATCPWRIALELAARGFSDATSPHQQGDQSIKDPALLDLIHADLEPAILVTYDHKMWLEHRGILDHFGTTLAVIDKNARPAHLTLEQYWRDVIHHHAHRFTGQAAGARFKYRQAGRSPLR
jgi:hypothetical protein